MRTRLALPIGRPGSRLEINTPALVLDLDAFESNVERMAAIMRRFGRGLRPHAKSHKSSVIAKAQLAAGALGVCCATLDEAEVMAAAGLRGLLITSPVTTRAKMRRLIDILADAPDTAIVVDNTANVAELGRAAAAAGVVLPVLIDIDLGFGRTGVRSLDAVEALLRGVLAATGTKLAGIQAYGGHLQHIVDYDRRVRETLEAASAVAGAVRRVEEIAGPVGQVSGGGTGTHAIDGGGGVFTEIQAGSYVFMDAEYNGVAYGPQQPWPFAVSLFVQTAVISSNLEGAVTVDAGTKAFALNGRTPEIVTPGLAGATFEFCGDEHGRVRLPAGATKPKLGDRIELIVSHCDPTVVLYDEYHCVRGDVLVDVWPIDARGRS